MQINLTWDLIVVLFVAVVTAYSFIVGKDESVKIIIASYITIVAVQGIGGILDALLGGGNATLAMLGFAMDHQIVAIIKLILFIVIIILLAIRGGFEMEYARELKGSWEAILIGAFGISTSALLLASLATYVADRPLLDRTLVSSELIQPLLGQSVLVRIVVEYQDIWFSLPAILLLVFGFLNHRSKKA